MARQGQESCRLYNRSTQRISLQVKPPNGDFFLHEQQIHLFPGKDVHLPKSHLLMDQVTNLRARGLISITYDSEAE